MNNNIKLTETQRQVLEHAADQPDGLVVWFPEGVKGGARQKVVQGLLSRTLIAVSRDTFVIASTGYVALGRVQPIGITQDTELALEHGVTVPVADHTQESLDQVPSLACVVAETKPRTRENSKQATVIEMLRRAEGATISQICVATGWQKHTVRGTFAGAFKRKLGLTITSIKADEGERVYRVA
jgi:hypothetical protein